MRHVIYLLAVINLVYFTWNMLQNMPHEGGAALVRRIPPSVRHLETIQEKAKNIADGAARVDRETMVETAITAASAGNAGARTEAADINEVDALTAAEPPGAIAAAPNCHVLGPFPDGTQMKAVVKRLNQLGYQPKERTSEIREQAGYWLYLPAMEREEVLRITRMLEDHNDRDYLILKDNALSLGAYESTSRVDMRLKMLHKYGLEPVVEPRYVTRTAYWLDLDLLDGEIDVLQTIRDESPEVKTSQAAACE